MTVRVYEQGVSVYVIGTHDAHEACRAAGITPETHRWSSTDFGMYVLRRGLWLYREKHDYAPLPKDARPGVKFCGPIRPWVTEPGGSDCDRKLP